MATDPASPVALIVKLQPVDLAQLEDLLCESHLPSEDCAAQLAAFFGIFEQAKLIAAGGLEAAGDYALLRSIVVRPDYRSQGLARALTEFLITEAENRGVRALYLLTESAESYFARFGFTAIDRDQAPGPIANTSQFSDLCPAGASFMELKLPTA